MIGQRSTSTRQRTKMAVLIARAEANGQFCLVVNRRPVRDELGRVITKQGAQRHRGGVVTPGRSRPERAEHITGPNQVQERVQQHRPGVTGRHLAVGDPGHPGRLHTITIAAGVIAAGVGVPEGLG